MRGEILLKCLSPRQKLLTARMRLTLVLSLSLRAVSQPELRSASVSPVHLALLCFLPLFILHFLLSQSIVYWGAGEEVSGACLFS